MTETVTGAGHTAGRWRSVDGILPADDEGNERSFIRPVHSDGWQIAQTCGPNGSSNARLIVAACNSYDRHFGPRAIEAAEADLLGRCLDVLREVVGALQGRVHSQPALSALAKASDILSQAQAREVTR